MVWLSPPQSPGQLLELQHLLDLLQGLLVVIEGQLGGLGLVFLLSSISSGVILGLPQVDLPQYHHLLVQLLAAGALLTVHCCVLLDSLILMLGGGRSLGLGGKAAATSWNNGELLRTDLAGADHPYVGFCSPRQSTFHAGNRLLQVAAVKLLYICY